MLRRETPFATHGELIVIGARVAGPRGTMTVDLVLDTGAAYTTITPKIAETVGYGERHRGQRTRVRTAIGSEQGYVLTIERIAMLGIDARNLPVHVFDLGHDIGGLVGLNFLHQLNFEVRSAERRILVERLAQRSA